VTPLSRILDTRCDVVGGAAWHVQAASVQRDELLAAMARRPEVVPLHVITLAAEHRVRLAYAVAHLLEWWRR
jgi:hypothetical protein